MTWQESQIKLEGTISSRSPINTIRLPISNWNQGIRPYFARRDESEGDVNLPKDDASFGLFTLLAQPKVHVRRIEHHRRGYREEVPAMEDYQNDFKGQIRTWALQNPEVLNGLGGIFGLDFYVSLQMTAHSPDFIAAWNNGQYLVWENGRAVSRDLPDPDYSEYTGAKYYVTIDNPEGLIRVNPLTQAKLVSVKVSPMFWDNDDMKWVPRGELQSMMDLRDAASPHFWFDKVDVWLNNQENWAVGVNMALQFVVENEDGSTKPILYQQVFPAQLDYELGGIAYMPIPAAYFPNDTRKVFPKSMPSNPESNATEDHIVFEVTMQTGSGYLAGTNADITATIGTCDGTTYSFPLATPHVDDFESGATRTYSRAIAGNPGPVVHVGFHNNNAGAHSGWQLASFQVTRRHLQSGLSLGTYVSQMSAPVWIDGGHSTYTESVDFSSACAQWLNGEVAGQTRPTIQPGTKVASSGGVTKIFGSGFGYMRNDVEVFVNREKANVLLVTPNAISIRVPPLAAGRYSLSVIAGGLATEPGAAEVEIRPDEPSTPPTPSFLTFDENPTTWHSNEAGLVSDSSNKVGNRGYALSIGGEGYRVARSPRFCATELVTYGTSLALDVYVPMNPSNPWWLGEVALFVDAPSAGVYNSWQGNVQLTGLAAGEWHTVEIPLNIQALAALGGTGCDLEFGVVLNAASASEPYHFDNMRFTGTILNSEGAPDQGEEPPTGTDADFVCASTCLQAEAAGAPSSPMTLNTTGEKWYVLSGKPAGWQASEIAGRTLSVNGVVLPAGATFPVAAADGKWYLRFSAGEHAWASWSWW